MFTKTSEAFGRTNIESLSKGTPVIGSLNGAVPELVNYTNIGFCSYNIEELASAITNYNFDNQACFDYPYSNFHVKTEIKNLLTVTKQIGIY